MLLAARYPTICRTCRKAVSAGVRIVWSKTDGARCLDCVPDWRTQTTPAQERMRRDLERNANQRSDTRSTYRRKVKHR
jgi:hypothetical protein